MSEPRPSADQNPAATGDAQAAGAAPGAPGAQRGLLARLPSVDRMLIDPGVQPLIATWGRELIADCTREALAAARDAVRGGAEPPGADALIARIAALAAQAMRPRLRPVFNLTGTVLHTNLGRALLPQSALDAVRIAATRPCALEYDLDAGGRGERDSLVEPLLRRITGAEAATVVNNNAAAVLLALATLAERREVLVSRGELVEIGGSFRIPDVMRRAGAKLVEVGTTNRTHASDYEAAFGPKTALALKVHASNYAIVGFTASVPRAELVALAHARGVPVMEDLGSGALVDLSRFGLPAEPTAQQALRAGVDLVTFSCDKLLGGPQAGIIVGRSDLIARIRKNPLKRALRVDKMTLAALEAVLLLHLDPDRLAQRVPTLRVLSRSQDEIRAQAERLLPAVRAAFDAVADVAVEPCTSQIGSGALPVERIASCALVVRPRGRRAGRLATAIERALRQLEVPVIARIAGAVLTLDLRCLEAEREAELLAQFVALRQPTG